MAQGMYELTGGNTLSLDGSIITQTTPSGEVSHVTHEVDGQTARTVFIAFCLQDHGPVDINILNEEDTGPVSY